MEIKRYAYRMRGVDGGMGLYDSDDGEWVRHDDVQQALSERYDLRDEIDCLKKMNETYREVIVRLGDEKDELRKRCGELEAELPMLQDVVTSCEAEIDRLRSRIKVSHSWLVEMMRDASAAWLGWDKPEDNLIPRLRLIGIDVDPE